MFIKIKDISLMRGFTLTEMLVVISIIGILLAVVGVRYGAVQEGARDTARLSDLGQISLTLNLYKQEHGNLPTLPSGESETICSDTSVCPAPLNDISQIVHDLGLLVGDPDQYVYNYTDSEPCNGNYDVATLRTSVEVASNDNTAEKIAVCSGLGSSDGHEHIVILEYFDR